MRNRRGHGEGSVRQLKSGKWQGCISLGFGTEGVRRRKYVIGDTRRQVTDKMARLRSQPNAAAAFDSRRMTVEQLMTRWLAERKARIQPSTYALYDQVIRIHILPQLGHIFAGAITSEFVTDYLENTSRSRRNAQLVLMYLGSAYSRAVAKGLLPSNPCADVDRPVAPEKKMRTLSQDEGRRFVTAARGTRFGSLFILAITTGLRRGELLGLQWSDVDLDRGFVSIQRAVTTLAGKTLVSPLKTRASRRRVNIAPIAIRELLEQKQKAKSEWVFPNDSGEPMCPSNLYNRFFLSILKTAELPRIRMHDLRHTAATFLLERGVHAKVVSEMLGHTSVATTLDVYSHVTPTMQFEAAAQMQSVFEPPTFKVKSRPMKRVRVVEPTQLAHNGARRDFAPQIEKPPIALTTGV
jgi:integrase